MEPALSVMAGSGASRRDVQGRTASSLPRCSCHNCYRRPAWRTRWPWCCGRLDRESAKPRERRERPPPPVSVASAHDPAPVDPHSCLRDRDPSARDAPLMGLQCARGANHALSAGAAYAIIARGGRLRARAGGLWAGPFRVSRPPPVRVPWCHGQQGGHGCRCLPSHARGAMACVTRVRAVLRTQTVVHARF